MAAVSATDPDNHPAVAALWQNIDNRVVSGCVCRSTCVKISLHVEVEQAAILSVFGCPVSAEEVRNAIHFRAEERVVTVDEFRRTVRAPRIKSSFRFH